MIAGIANAARQVGTAGEVLQTSIENSSYYGSRFVEYAAAKDCKRYLKPPKKAKAKVMSTGGFESQ